MIGKQLLQPGGCESILIVFVVVVCDMHRNNMGKRIEEGVAILVKSEMLTSTSRRPANKKNLHVAGVKALFLPRNFSDKR